MFPIKILITTDTFTPTVNGVVASVINLYHQLSESGNDVRILTLSDDNTSKKIDSIYYIKSFGLKIYPDSKGTSAFHDPFLEELIEWKPDLIHTQSEFFTFLMAKIIARKTYAPIIHTYHTLYESYTHYFTRNKALGKLVVAHLTKRLMGHVDGIVAPTSKVKQVLLSYGVDTKIAVVPTGIELERFEKQVHPHKLEALREKYRIPKENRILLTVGRLGEEKNISELFSHLEIIRQQMKNITLMLVGDGPYHEELEKLACSMGLAENVVFTGMVSPDEIPDYYKLADVYINASTSETQGLTFLEALASGIPVVCRYDSCLNEVIRPGINGYFYHDGEEGVGYIRALLEDPALYGQMGQAAVDSVREYTVESFGKRIFRLYQTQAAGGALSQRRRYKMKLFRLLIPNKGEGKSA